MLSRIITAGSERLPITEITEDLRDAYLAAGVIGKRYADDALHVAHATIARADIIVSWNFRHLVNPDRIRAFNGVNVSLGYGFIVIVTPSDAVKIIEELNYEENQDI